MFLEIPLTDFPVFRKRCSSWPRPPLLQVWCKSLCQFSSTRPLLAALFVDLLRARTRAPSTATSPAAPYIMHHAGHDSSCIASWHTPGLCTSRVRSYMPTRPRPMRGQCSRGQCSPGRQRPMRGQCSPGRQRCNHALKHAANSLPWIRRTHILEHIHACIATAV